MGHRHPAVPAGRIWFALGLFGVYALLTTEEIFRLAVSLVIFKKRSWMISL